MPPNSSDILLRFETNPAHPRELSDSDRIALDVEIEDLMRRIRGCDSSDAADDLLQELGQIQTNLATLAFKYRVPLSPRQRQIVRQYDRFDVLDLRRKTFHQIKNADYPWRDR